MDYDDIISKIDHLHGDIIDVFGHGSATQQAVKSLYEVACKEAKAFEEDTRPSDANEFLSVWMCQQAAQARAMAKER